MEIHNFNSSLFKEILSQLIELPNQKPKNKDEMLILNRNNLDLILRINALGFDDCPSEIRHYLSDADIRFKDEKYAEYQTKKLLDAIDSWKNNHKTLI
jgi:hypothetical protein